MALWKDDPGTAKKDTVPIPAERATTKEKDEPATPSPDPEMPTRAKKRESLESVISADLTIEGKIEGSGHVRLVGKFKGDVHVEGDLTIEAGAKVNGTVRARKVVIGGELEGNVDAASSVQLLETGVVNGDVNAGSLIVEAGSRMRGQADFGWDEKESKASRMKMESGTTP